MVGPGRAFQEALWCTSKGGEEKYNYLEIDRRITVIGEQGESKQEK